jgi:hypothetical protein
MEFYYVIFKFLDVETVRVWAKGREKDFSIVSVSLSSKSLYVRATPAGVQLLQKCFANVLSKVIKA